MLKRTLIIKNKNAEITLTDDVDDDVFELRFNGFGDFENGTHILYIKGFFDALVKQYNFQDCKDKAIPIQSKRNSEWVNVGEIQL